MLFTRLHKLATITQRFETFLSNIQLTDAQIQDAVRKHTGVRRVLHNRFYNTAFQKSISDIEELQVISETIRAYKSFNVLLDENVPYRTSLLVGSYGKNTEIAPPSDIDILFEMPGDMYEHYNSRSYNGQSKLLQDIRNVLLAAYPRTEIVGDGQVVTVPFVTYRVEVLPAFRLQSRAYYYPDTHLGGSWRITHPRAEKENLVASNNLTKGNTIRLIKMMKAWKAFCNVPIKSTGIELLAIGFFANWMYKDKTALYFDWMVRDFLEYMLRFVNGNLSILGVTESIALGDAWKSKVEVALARSKQACAYETDKKDSEAELEWKKIFGDRYYF